MKVALIPNLDKRGSSDMVEKIGVFLSSNGIEAYLPNSICCEGYKFAPEDELYKIADIIITETEQLSVTQNAPRLIISRF